jgi:hypothetical protein
MSKPFTEMIQKKDKKRPSREATEKVSIKNKEKSLENTA